MKLRILVSLVAALTFLGISAHAQDSTKFDAGIGYSYVHLNPGGDDLDGNGGFGTIAYNFNNTFAVVGSFTGDTITCPSCPGSVTGYSYLFGPRLSWHHDGKVVPFTQVLFGGAHIGTGGNNTNAFAMAWGLGIDLKVTHHVYIRPIQADYFFTHFGGATQNNLSLESGLIFHF